MARLLAAVWIMINICPLFAAEAEVVAGLGGVSYRALLIACDDFVTYPSTAPNSHNNLLAIEMILERDPRGFTIRRQDGITQSAQALAAAIQWAFRDADDNDVSYLYMSTHGLFDENGGSPRGALILSDGAEEAVLTAGELRAMLDPIPGDKVLLIDACYSGALIGKGVSPGEHPERITEIVAGDRYKALVSSGGSEPSWYWRGGVESQPLGSSYFTAALAQGAGMYGEYPADRDRNGAITLAEMNSYLRISCAASSVQCSAQEDPFVLFEYDPLAQADDSAPLSGFVFDRVTLSEGFSEMKFSFTVRESTRIGYQLVTMRDGVWDWTRARMWLDSMECPDTLDGSVRPGRKSRSINIDGIDASTWGYVLLNVVRFGDDGNPVVRASRVIAVQPSVGNPRLSVRVTSSEASPFIHGNGDIEIFVGHALPCSLSIKIENEDGSFSRWLAVSQPTRPQGLSPEGSLFYWNGRNAAGMDAPPGEYTVTVTARVGGRAYQASAKLTIGAGYHIFGNGITLPPSFILNPVSFGIASAQAR